MSPLTLQQQQTVLDWLPEVKQWVIDRNPVLTSRRETLEANALYTLCQAVLAWPGNGDFKAYLFACLRNGKIAEWKAENKHYTVPKRRKGEKEKKTDKGNRRILRWADGLDFLPWRDQEPDRDLTLLEERAEIIKRRLIQLPDEQRQALEMTAQDRSQKEIAESLGLSTRTIRRRLDDARKEFEKLFPA